MIAIFGDVAIVGAEHHGCCVVDDISVVLTRSGPTARPVASPTASPILSLAPNSIPTSYPPNSSPTADLPDDRYFYVGGVYKVGGLSLPVSEQCFAAKVDTSGSSVKFSVGDSTTSSSASSSYSSSSSFSLGLSGVFRNILAALSFGHSTSSSTRESSSTLTRNYNFDYSITLPRYSYHSFKLSDVGADVLRRVRCDPVAFAKSCGNAIPLSVTYGATVNVQLAFSFSDSSYASSFSNSWSASSSLAAAGKRLPSRAKFAASITHSNSNSEEFYTSQSLLSVSFTQFGGPAIQPALGYCSLDNLNDCINGINNIIQQTAKSFSNLNVNNAVPTLGPLQDVTTIISGLPDVSYTTTEQQSVNRAINWIQNAVNTFQQVWSDMNDLLNSEKSLLNVAQKADAMGVKSCASYTQLFSSDTKDKITDIIAAMRQNIVQIENFMTTTCLPDLLSCENNIFSFLLSSLTVYQEYNLYDADFKYAFSPTMSLNADYYYNQVWIIPSGETGPQGGQYYFFPIVGTGKLKRGYSLGQCTRNQAYGMAPFMEYASFNSFRHTDYIANPVTNPLWKQSYACSNSVGYYNDMNCLLAYVGSTNGAGADCAGGVHVPGRNSLKNNNFNKKYFDHTASYNSGCGASVSRFAVPSDFGPIQTTSVRASTAPAQCTVPDAVVGSVAITNVEFPNVQITDPVSDPVSDSVGLTMRVSTWMLAGTVGWVCLFLF